MGGAFFELKVPWGAIRLRPGPDGLRTADALSLESETQTATEYVAGTSSGAAAGRFTSENTTGHVLRPAADRSLCGSVLQAVICRPKCAALKRQSYQVHCDTFDWARGWGWAPPFRNSSRGRPGVLFLDTSVILCRTYCVFERAPRPRKAFFWNLET